MNLTDGRRVTAMGRPQSRSVRVRVSPCPAMALSGPAASRRAICFSGCMASSRGRGASIASHVG